MRQTERKLVCRYTHIHTYAYLFMMIYMYEFNTGLPPLLAALGYLQLEVRIGRFPEYSKAFLSADTVLFRACGGMN